MDPWGQGQVGSCPHALWCQHHAAALPPSARRRANRNLGACCPLRRTCTHGPLQGYYGQQYGEAYGQGYGAPPPPPPPPAVDDFLSSEPQQEGAPAEKQQPAPEHPAEEQPAAAEEASAGAACPPWRCCLRWEGGGLPVRVAFATWCRPWPAA